MQGYEAAQVFKDRRDNIDFEDAEAIRKIDGRQEVQAELAQQEADLSDLERETELSDGELAERLRRRARANPPLYLEQLRNLA